MCNNAVAVISGKDKMGSLIEDMMKKVPDEQTRHKMENLLLKIEEMNCFVLYFVLHRIAKHYNSLQNLGKNY